MADGIVNLADFGVHPNREEDQTDSVVAALRRLRKTVDFNRLVQTLREDLAHQQVEQQGTTSHHRKERFLKTNSSGGIRFEKTTWACE